MRKPIMITVVAIAVIIAGASIAAKTNRQLSPKMDMSVPSKSAQSQPLDNQTINPNTQGTIPFAPPMPEQPQQMPGGMRPGMGMPQQMPGGMMPGMGQGMPGGMMPQIVMMSASMTTAQDGSLYVLRGNTLYKYSADLVLQKSVELPAPRTPQNPQPGMMPMQNGNPPRPMGMP